MVEVKLNRHRHISFLVSNPSSPIYRTHCTLCTFFERHTYGHRNRTWNGSSSPNPGTKLPKALANVDSSTCPLRQSLPWPSRGSRWSRVWTNPTGLDLQLLCGQFLPCLTWLPGQKLQAVHLLFGLIETVVIADGPERRAHFVCIFGPPIVSACQIAAIYLPTYGQALDSHWG